MKLIMRKLASVFILTGCLFANARQISPGEAMTLASDFLNSSQLLVASPFGSKTLTPMRVPGVDADVAASPYYVFNRGESDGFVIISGDDRAPKILGYADRGSFDPGNVPPQLKAMMEQWATQMEQLPAGVVQHSSWRMATATRAEDGILLETAEWGQGAPYNADTPIMEGENCPTGCVATAMSIMMKYHNWPEGFDWDAMPLNNEKDPIDYELSYPAIADLMAKAGEAVFMEYNTWESGANMNWVGHRLQSVFKYSPDCQFITSANFTDDEWTEMIHSNLDKGNPIIYSGSGSGSHAFIIDGYNATAYHVNWGWDGYCNGYFVLDALSPNEYQDFSKNTGMVINIVPDKTGNVYSESFTDAGYLWSTAGSVKMNISVADVRKGESFSLANSGMTVFRGFEGLIGIALVDKDNNIKEILGSNEYNTWNPMLNDYEDKGAGFYIFNVTPSVDVAPTDRIQLVSKDKKDSDFRLILGTLEWPSYVGVTGNNPRFSKIKFNISEDTEFEYGYGDGYYSVPSGNEEREILTGVFLGFSGIAKNSSDNRILNVTIKGNMIYGDSQTLSDPYRVSTSFDVIGDEYSIDLRTVELKDEYVYLENAGTLKDVISEENGAGVRRLTIDGKMNALDFWHIRKYFSSLRYLDLSKVKVEAVFASDEGFFLEPIENKADYIPEFALCGLENLNVLYLPENIKGIESDAFMSLGLNSVSIPAGVDYIGLNVFFDNRKLNEVELLNPEPVAINDCVFTSSLCPIEGVLYVPVGSADKYRQSPVWQDFKEIIEGRRLVMVESIQLSVDSWIGVKGESFLISALVLPENATDKSIEWSSSDESVATVDANGNVSILKEGSCVITATTTDGSGIYAECIITSASGIDAIFSGSDSFSVYGLNGSLIKKDCNRLQLKTLTPGIYIIRNGHEMKKLVIR